MKLYFIAALLAATTATAVAAEPQKYCEDAGGEVVTCTSPDGSSTTSYTDGTVVYCSTGINGSPQCVRSDS